MNTWSLPRLLEGLHDSIEQRLALTRKTLAHPVTKGDATEAVWLQVLKTYLPRRYRAAKAQVVDSNGNFSEQIDIVIFDRQYSPFIFQIEGQTVIPAESVYAVFEAKQSINADRIGYAQKKASSVRRLYRTNLPIPHAGGTYDPRPLSSILAGIVTLESEWSPALGVPFVDSLAKDNGDGLLDLACIAAHGFAAHMPDGEYVINVEGKSATAFLFELIARLQSKATVPMIDVRAYGRWLNK